MKEENNTENNSKKGKQKRKENLILWKPGQSGNPKGRPVGARNYRTIYREALVRIADMRGYSPDEVEDAMTVKAIEKAIKGDFFFYRDIHDRLHGKPKETMDLTSGGKSIAEVLVALNNGGNKRGPSKRATAQNTK